MRSKASVALACNYNYTIIIKSCIAINLPFSELQYIPSHRNMAGMKQLGGPTLLCMQQFHSVKHVKMFGHST